MEAYGTVDSLWKQDISKDSPWPQIKELDAQQCLYSAF